MAYQPAFHCQITLPLPVAVGTPLPVDFREVGRGILPHPWWDGRQRGNEVEVEEVNASGTNLPSIHTLGLLELGQASDDQHDPLNTVASPTTTISTLFLGTPELQGTAQHQLPSQLRFHMYIPEQDSPSDSQDESSGDSSDGMESEGIGGGSSPLSYGWGEQGSGFIWRSFGPSEFADMYWRDNFERLVLY